MIAEAFWLMEKYFINEIGMHRVYNSAFMHQLRDEENAKFRAYLREILQTNPAMLERFVNFLTTPDEEPAVLQFGREQKYLGACRLLALHTRVAIVRPWPMGRIKRALWHGHCLPYPIGECGSGTGCTA